MASRIFIVFILKLSQQTYNNIKTVDFKLNLFFKSLIHNILVYVIDSY